MVTPPEVMTLVRQVLGTIDVDPASCLAAQEVVQARTYYTVEDDGLRHPWTGTVFCNPSYQMPEVARFCGKLLEELDAGHTTAAILLVNSVTDNRIRLQHIAPRAAALCFTDGRIASCMRPATACAPVRARRCCTLGRTWRAGAAHAGGQRQGPWAATDAR